MADFLNGLPQILGGLFGNSDRPYQKAQDSFNQYNQQAQNQFEPYSQAGQRGLNKYQNFLSQYKNPQDFLSKIMSGYNESPGARYQQQMGTHAATNAFSAAGLTGSTPFAQFLDQQSQGIASQDMQQYLKNILGIGDTYLGGQQHLMDQGFNANSHISSLLGNAANTNSGLEYGQQAGKQQDLFNLLGGLFNSFGGGSSGGNSGGGFDMSSLAKLLPFLTGG